MHGDVQNLTRKSDVKSKGEGGVTLLGFGWTYENARLFPV